MCCLKKDQERPQLKRRGSNCQAYKVVSTGQLPGADARLPPASSACPGHVTERPLCPLRPLQSRHFLLGQCLAPMSRELDEVLAQGQAQAGSHLQQVLPPNLLPPSLVLITGGIVATAGHFTQWYFGAYSMYPSMGERSFTLVLGDQDSVVMPLLPGLAVLQLSCLAAASGSRTRSVCSVCSFRSQGPGLRSRLPKGTEWVQADVELRPVIPSL